MTLIDEIKEMVIRGHINNSSKYPTEYAGKPGVEELVQKAIKENTPVDEILKKGLVAGMDVVGEKFSQGEYFVPEMMFSAKAMKAGVALLKPLLVDAESHIVGTVILGTVQGDMHDIGKNLVAMMLEGAGFKVIDLGINIAPEVFLKTAKENPQALVGMSALLTVTMQKMRDVVKTIRSEHLTNKIIIGGAPVSRQFAKEIGADGYAADASAAVKEVKTILNIS
jgi:5-methyltetrahydrofolate--homocysteine methyltransferase